MPGRAIVEACWPNSARHSARQHHGLEAVEQRNENQRRAGYRHDQRHESFSQGSRQVLLVGGLSVADMTCFRMSTPTNSLQASSKRAKTGPGRPLPIAMPLMRVT